MGLPSYFGRGRRSIRLALRCERRVCQLEVALQHMDARNQQLVDVVGRRAMIDRLERGSKRSGGVSMIAKPQR